MTAPASLPVVIVGGGPAGLMAADILSGQGVPVHIYDRMPTFGRKFLMAGRGGLNLTHSEPLGSFLGRYGPAVEYLRPAIEAFPPSKLREWAEGLGQPTFVGSSGRVFPRAMKASPLLRAWLVRLQERGGRFFPRHDWLGWDDAGLLRFRRPDGGNLRVEAAATLLALGGASWPRLGADGGWAGILAGRGVAVTALRPSNCGFTVGWSEIFRSKHEGQPLKNLALSFAGRTARGEAIITASGIEGGAVYALSAPLRDAIADAGSATLSIDLLPDRSPGELTQRLGRPRGAQSHSTFLRRMLGLAPAAIGLLHEAFGPKLPADPGTLARAVKAVPLRLIAPQPLDRAISTAGGIALSELDAYFMLKRMPGVFAAGEMLDWEAPTGGYLLQACLATGAMAARGIAQWMRFPRTEAR